MVQYKKNPHMKTQTKASKQLVLHKKLWDIRLENMFMLERLQEVRENNSRRCGEKAFWKVAACK